MTTRTTTTGTAHPLAAAVTTATEPIDAPAGTVLGHTAPAVSASARRLRGYALRISAAASSRLRIKAPRRFSIARGLTVLGWAAVIAVCAYAGLAAMIYFAQRSLMYFPDRTYTTPAAAGLPEASEVPLTASDGVKIHVWQVPPQPGKPIILYFHGNGGSLRYRVDRFRRLIGAGIGLVALEYRGYGGLSGSPTERGLIRDAEAAYAYTAARYPTPQIVVWGESLGSAVAVALAAEKPVGRLILEAPFTSALAIAESRYWYLPVRLLMKDQFRSDERIKKVTAPLLILHGVNDRIVPFKMGEQMFELANKPKHIVRFLDGGHEDLDQNGALDAVARFLAGDLD
ncbi:MAG: alpha/beta fold hydrolase [Xanthobacteraceae bacterium]